MRLMAQTRMRTQANPSEFSQRLRALRIHQNLQQKELAARVGIHVLHYGRYERGLSQPSASVLRRLAEALGVSGDYLLTGHNEKAAQANIEDLELLQLFQEVQAFPSDEKVMVKKILEAFVVKRKLQALAAG